MSSDREKEVEKVANFIINNISLATSITILISKARETAEFIVDNNYEKEDFEIYLKRNNNNESNLSVENSHREKFSLKKLWEKVRKKIPFLRRKRTGFSTRR
jgi:predicted RNase H-like nuclease (RuvC/YqgF family)